ncbi:beta-1,4 N-acetylgalactosaminyltransferase 2-like [Ptychodera flava]|uniref:beta-1,4 N-acetylgalactosaminyltransferase 2-like n=1 Tax=Ptychodera flava TaxID=63121 RepID=UPI00396A54EA
MAGTAVYILLTSIDTGKIYKYVVDGAIQNNAPQFAGGRNIGYSEENMLYKVCRIMWNRTTRLKKEHSLKDRRSKCSCGKGAYESISKESLTRRKKALEEWKRDEERKKEPFVVYEALSPLSYPGSGLVVEPGMTIPITPMNLHPLALKCLRHGFHGNEIMIDLSCKGELGKIFISSNSHNLSWSAEIVGNNTHSLQIALPAITNVSQSNTDNDYKDVINILLSSIHYRSVYYDILARDVISVKVQNFISEINVLIKRSTMPLLFDPGPDDDIAGKVTIVTKTFERPQSIQNLVRSVRIYYPHVTIVIADDSKNASRIHGDNIKYYTMPFDEGWFAGRNLVISQVRTKYFLWVDDDFEFTEGTDLQKFVDKFEDAEERLDVVAGILEKTGTFTKTLSVLGGDENGDCLFRKPGSHRKLKNYPQCNRADVVVNFFMAKTLSVRRIGFDPEYQRLGHTEFFMDGLGHLSVATCSDVTVKHARYKPENYMYYRNRKDDPNDLEKSVEHTLFKNNLKCFRLG